MPGPVELVKSPVHRNPQWICDVESATLPSECRPDSRLAGLCTTAVVSKAIDRDL